MLDPALQSCFTVPLQVAHKSDLLLGNSCLGSHYCDHLPHHETLSRMLVIMYSAAVFDSGTPMVASCNSSSSHRLTFEHRVAAKMKLSAVYRHNTMGLHANC